jgi:uncharacterized protein (DUF2062 family)
MAAGIVGATAPRTVEGTAGVVFKRRDQRGWIQTIAQALWPRGGWARAFQYVQHRLRRLPGTPEQIARGIFAGAVTVFTPLFRPAFRCRGAFGEDHARLDPRIASGNLHRQPADLCADRDHLAADGAFPAGHLAPGRGRRIHLREIRRRGGDLWHNFLAIFTPERAEWHELEIFYRDVFFPWLVGGLIPGVVCGLVCYYLSVPVIRAYQKRRAARLRKKMDKLRRQAGAVD